MINSNTLVTRLHKVPENPINLLIYMSNRPWTPLETTWVERLHSDDVYWGPSCLTVSSLTESLTEQRVFTGICHKTTGAERREQCSWLWVCVRVWGNRKGLAVKWRWADISSHRGWQARGFPDLLWLGVYRQIEGNTKKKSDSKAPIWHIRVWPFFFFCQFRYWNLSIWTGERKY